MENKNCCLESCDMFDFMSNYVGRRILHPGGVKSTNKLFELLKIDKNKKVLDIACGKGLTSIYLAKKYGCHVVGVDIHEKSIEEANFLAKKRGVSHLVSFQVADASALPFSNNEFDVIFAQALLILVKDKIKERKIIEEAVRVLKPLGHFGWIELSWKKQPSSDFLNIATETICGICVANTETYQGWEGLFKNSGVKEINIYKYDMNTRNIRGMIEDEGLVNGFKIMFKMTDSKIRKRMMKLNNFFKSNPEYCGYGIYIGSK